jgi:cullin-associated NEDD8-dissociated protein 1
MDVFNTFIELLRQTGNVTKGQMDMDESRQASFFSLFLFDISVPSWFELENSPKIP